MTTTPVPELGHRSDIGWRIQMTAKRALDVVGASVLLVVLAPLLLVVAAAVRLTSPGPAIFRQERLGRYQEPFLVLKFRSMYRDATPDAHRRFLYDQANGVCADVEHFKVIADPRVTPVGRFIRRSSIDELPQLINVLRGEMSLVGPRPDLPYSLDIYESHHYRRFDVLPGMTGLWQVSGRSELAFLDMLDLDALYAQHWSFRLDLLILARTIPELLATDRAG